jgi:hypothetical protein
MNYKQFKKILDVRFKTPSTHAVHHNNFSLASLCRFIFFLSLYHHSLSPSRLARTLPRRATPLRPRAATLTSAYVFASQPTRLRATCSLQHHSKTHLTYPLFLPSRAQAAKLAFQVFDRDEDRKLGVDDLRDTLTDHEYAGLSDDVFADAARLTDADVQAVMYAADPASGGESISRAAFHALFNNAGAAPKKGAAAADAEE